jgi:hypothetical protein
MTMNNLSLKSSGLCFNIHLYWLKSWNGKTLKPAVHSFWTLTLKTISSRQSFGMNHSTLNRVIKSWLATSLKSHLGFILLYTSVSYLASPSFLYFQMGWVSKKSYSTYWNQKLILKILKRANFIFIWISDLIYIIIL